MNHPEVLLDAIRQVLAEQAQPVPTPQVVDLARYFAEREAELIAPLPTVEITPPPAKRKTLSKADKKRMKYNLTPAQAKRAKKNAKRSCGEVAMRFETIKALKPLKKFTGTVRMWLWMQAPVEYIRDNPDVIKVLKIEGFFFNPARSTPTLSVWCHDGGVPQYGRATVDPRLGAMHPLGLSK